MKKPTESWLVVSALGSDKPTLISTLAAAFRDCGCSLRDSRMTVLGSEFAMVMLLAGQWNAIAKAEGVLPKLEASHGLSLHARRTEPRPTTHRLIPYNVEVIAVEQLGIVHDVADFFAQREINIDDMMTTSYTASHSGTLMYSLHMTIGLPINTAIATIRGEFMDFCDELNLDAVLSPCR